MSEAHPSFYWKQPLPLESQGTSRGCHVVEILRLVMQ